MATPHALEREKEHMALRPAPETSGILRRSASVLKLQIFRKHATKGAERVRAQLFMRARVCPCCVITGLRGSIVFRA